MSKYLKTICVVHCSLPYATQHDNFLNESKDWISDAFMQYRNCWAVLALDSNDRVHYHILESHQYKFWDDSIWLPVTTMPLSKHLKCILFWFVWFVFLQNILFVFLHIIYLKFKWFVFLKMQLNSIIPLEMHHGKEAGVQFCNVINF